MRESRCPRRVVADARCALNYFKPAIAGEVVEVDTQNLARKVGGVCQTTEVGNAVGLSMICFIHVTVEGNC
jgi:hypothetical protein